MAPAGTGAEKVLHLNTIKSEEFPTILFSANQDHGRRLIDARLQITSVWQLVTAAQRRLLGPRPRELRAFCGKSLTHHKHQCQSAPPLRKTPPTQKALRALRPLLDHAGSTKFDRPQKTQAFFGALELQPYAGVVRKGGRPRFCIQTITVSGSRLAAACR
jgi:hypothetical protein